MTQAEGRGAEGALGFWTTQGNPYKQPQQPAGAAAAAAAAKPGYEAQPAGAGGPGAAPSGRAGGGGGVALHEAWQGKPLGQARLAAGPAGPAAALPPAEQRVRVKQEAEPSVKQEPQDFQQFQQQQQQQFQPQPGYVKQEQQQFVPVKQEPAQQQQPAGHPHHQPPQQQQPYIKQEPQYPAQEQHQQQPQQQQQQQPCQQGAPEPAAAAVARAPLAQWVEQDVGAYEAFLVARGARVPLLLCSITPGGCIGPGAASSLGVDDASKPIVV